LSATKRRQRAAILSIGDELMAGVHPDLNAPFLAAKLKQLGVVVCELRVIADDEKALAEAMRELCARYDLLLVSGGLGPTLDDVTRHAAAAAAGVAIEHSPEAMDDIREWFMRSGRPMPDSNDRQALLPAGAESLANACGTAPGFRLRIGEAYLCAMPGPPRELQDMFQRKVRPWIGQQWPTAVAPLRAQFHLFGVSESLFADKVGSWMARAKDELLEHEPLMGVTANSGALSVHITAMDSRGERGQRLFEERVVAFRARFQEAIYSEQEANLSLVLANRLIDASITVTTAESCTGGLVAGALTRAAGVSAVLGQAFVTYSDESKTRMLGVPEELISKYGAVSIEVARAMAAGAAERSGARLALAITGIAGPGGGTEEKPVGTVCFASCFDGHLRDGRRQFPNAGRESVRGWATTWALGMGLQAISGLS
jgi:nicotinamide-nucleotide amidase